MTDAAAALLAVVRCLANERAAPYAPACVARTALECHGAGAARADCVDALEYACGALRGPRNTFIAAAVCIAAACCIAGAACAWRWRADWTTRALRRFGLKRVRELSP